MPAITRTLELVILFAAVILASQWPTFAMASHIDKDEVQKSGSAGGTVAIVLAAYAAWRRKEGN